MADGAPVQNAGDSIERNPGLVRKKRGHHDGADQIAGRALPAVHGTLEPPHQPVHTRRYRGDDNGKTHHKGPHPGSGRNQPTHQEQKESRHRHKAAPQIIQNPPAVNNAQRIRLVRPGHSGHGPERPARDLPVSPYPPVLPRREARVIHGQMLK